MIRNIWQRILDWLAPKLDADGWEVYSSETLLDAREQVHIFRRYRRKISAFKYEFKDDPLPAWAEEAIDQYYRRQW